jgi:hypothetical protein
VKDSQLEFWEWFNKHQDELFGFEIGQVQIFDKLSEQLIRVHPDLTFEFGPKSDQREFVVSAGGMRDAFSAVSSLVAAAPKLNRWRITAFRPRRTPLNSVEIGDICIRPEDVQFSLLTKGSVIGIHLFIPGFQEDNVVFRQIAYLMLDDALGEYDVETKVGLIKISQPEAAQTTKRHPLFELPALFDQLVSALAAPSLPN